MPCHTPPIKKSKEMGKCHYPAQILSICITQPQFHPFKSVEFREGMGLRQAIAFLGCYLLEHMDA